MLDRQPLALSYEFSAVLSQIETERDNFFVTGRAGTGKSTLLQLFRSTSKKRMAILAPTGIAALNVRGQTIHSFFGFAPRMLNASDIKKRPNHRMYKNIDTIVIDEISMVRADVIDNIDIFLRKNREINLPFGGVQMIFFGDLYQLPPVVATSFEKHHFTTVYQSPYFYSANVIAGRTNPFKMIELRTVYRQQELSFINILDAVRTGEFEYEDLLALNERSVPLPEDHSYFVTLTSTNSAADRINKFELDKLQKPPFIAQATITGDFAPQLYPTDPLLTLRADAQVMFIKNDTDRKYVNGTIGIISRIEENRVYVNVPQQDGEIIEILAHEEEWEIIKYTHDIEKPKNIDTKVVGTFKQLPLKLAWAITIHKSQGKTFDKVVIDLGRGAFEYGQTYVALSRCRTLDGIYLTKPLTQRDILVDQTTNEFYSTMRRFF